jgi:hypothetical protein
MKSFNSLLILTFALILFSVSARAQSQTFAREGVEYTVELPSNTWRAVSQPDSIHQHVEFVYGDRMDGYLRIRKELVDAGTSVSQLAERDQESKLRFRPGYVQGKGEQFAGRHEGYTTSYEFTNGGKPMLGRIYYLKADNRTIYTLHFTGTRDKLQRIRNQTDFIARSFKLK